MSAYEQRTLYIDVLINLSYELGNGGFASVRRVAVVGRMFSDVRLAGQSLS